MTAHTDPLDNAEYRAICEDVHTYFGLTYANYLVLPRTLLQSMPDEWQARFVACLEQLQAAFWEVPQANEYMVRAKDSNGHFIADPVPHYNRGRTYVAPHIDGARGASDQSSRREG